MGHGQTFITPGPSDGEAQVPYLFEAIALVILLAMSAFFSMSETAMVSADRIRVQEAVHAGDKRALRLQALLREPERLLTTVLVGNNLVNIAAVAVATALAVDVFGRTGPAIATAAMTVLVLVFAEITPKTIAVRRAYGIALRVAFPLRIVEMALLPLVVLFSALARGILSLVGMRMETKSPFITQAQIEALVRLGVKEGEVERFEEQVITEVFDFTETPVEQVMTPRERVRHVAKDAVLHDALDVIAHSGHSRIPVVEGDFDHVLGFVHAKDLLRFTDQELRQAPVTLALRGVLYVQRGTRADRVLVRMQKERKLLTVIQDEEGKNLGIATVEDLLEELVGEIHDEFDHRKPDPKPAGPQHT